MTLNSLHIPTNHFLRMLPSSLSLQNVVLLLSPFSCYSKDRDGSSGSKWAQTRMVWRARTHKGMQTGRGGEGKKLIFQPEKLSSEELSLPSGGQTCSGQPVTLRFNWSCFSVQTWSVLNVRALRSVSPSGRFVCVCVYHCLPFVRSTAQPPLPVFQCDGEVTGWETDRSTLCHWLAGSHDRWGSSVHGGCHGNRHQRYPELPPPCVSRAGASSAEERSVGRRRCLLFVRYCCCATSRCYRRSSLRQRFDLWGDFLWHQP